LEWNSSLYINFIDYEKAFDSGDKDTLWKLLIHYNIAIPKKIVTIIQQSYKGMSCHVIFPTSTFTSGITVLRKPKLSNNPVFNNTHITLP